MDYMIYIINAVILYDKKYKYTIIRVMIKIFCRKFIHLCLSYFIDNINKYFIDMGINSEIILYTNESYIEKYIIENNVKNSFIIYIQTHPKNSISCDYHNVEFLFNIEQMKKYEYRTLDVEALVHHNINIIDYNTVNINFAKKINETAELYYIPYLYHDEGNKNEMLYDVCIIGSYSEHRNNIYNELIEKGCNAVYIYNKYGKECDNIISESKIILNLHYLAETDILETIRCYQALYKKKVVISEKSLYDENNDLDNLIIYSPYNEIVDKVFDVLKNYSIHKKKLDDFNYTKIKHEHQMIIANFLHYYKYFDLTKK